MLPSNLRGSTNKMGFLVLRVGDREIVPGSAAAGAGEGDFEETVSQHVAASGSCCACKPLSPGIPAGRSGAVCSAATALSTADQK